MSDISSDVDVVIVGAGAAGLGAARTVRDLGLTFELLEASHRIGGRAYTEPVGNGLAFDLGCHWLHSGSINPFTGIADRLGFSYATTVLGRNLHLGRGWASDAEQQALDLFIEDSQEAITTAAAAGEDRSIADVTPREHRWTGLYDYLVSLNHSVDSDQCSLLDAANYHDTEENWPLREGYGTLLARFGSDIPVRLNAAVRRLDWSGRAVAAETAKGTVRARAAILTVSTGVLGAGDIDFQPALPNWKLGAISHLPLGCHNWICLVLDGDPFGTDARPWTLIQSGAEDSEPMSFYLRPFGFDYVVGTTGGRFADWLERAGIQASTDFTLEKLKQVFGTGIAKRVTGTNVTAWRGDPWTRGAYSAALPGHHGARADLGKALEERLFFAGEACSSGFFATCHGAYLNGIETAQAVARQLSPAIG